MDLFIVSVCVLIAIASTACAVRCYRGMLEARLKVSYVLASVGHVQPMDPSLFNVVPGIVAVSHKMALPSGTSPQAAEEAMKQVEAIAKQTLLVYLETAGHNAVDQCGPKPNLLKQNPLPFGS